MNVKLRCLDCGFTRDVSEPKTASDLAEAHEEGRPRHSVIVDPYEERWETPDHLNDSERVKEGLLEQPPESAGELVYSGAYALRKAHSANELVLYKAIEVIEDE